MRNFFLLLVVILSAFSLAYAEDVLVLTEENFDSIVDSEELILVEFYAPWCGHCKRLAPEYEKAAGVLSKNDPPVPLAKVDATEEASLAGRFGIRGYPTLKVFRNGAATDYEGPRTADGIVKYMRSRVGPAAIPIDSSASLVSYLDKYNRHLPTVVGFFSDESSSRRSTFLRVAEESRELFAFAELVGEHADARSQYGIEDEDAVVVIKPTLHFHKKYDEKPFTTTTVLKYHALKEFVYDTALPLVSEYTTENAELFHHAELPLFLFYFETDYDVNPKESNYYANRVRKAAKQHSEKLVFGVANSMEFEHQLSDFGMEGETLVATILDNDLKYKFDGEFSADNLKQFVQQFVDGELQVYIKSEDVPVSQDDAVVTVVGKTFDEIVHQEDKDVLIEFYAPWCGHCKNLAPKYEELAEKYAENDNIVIAKIDATANDFPRDKYQVTGFPTIFLSKAGEKDRPMRYNGDREVEDFVAFLENEATSASSKPATKKRGRRSKNKDEL